MCYFIDDKTDILRSKGFKAIASAIRSEDLFHLPWSTSFSSAITLPSISYDVVLGSRREKDVFWLEKLTHTFEVGPLVHLILKNNIEQKTTWNQDNSVFNPAVWSL